MAALTSNYEAKRQDGIILTYPVKTNVRIYKGALVTIGSDGFALLALQNTDDKFAGVCVEEANNTGGANGAILVKVYTKGVFQYTKPTAATSDLQTKVYARNDNEVDTAVTGTKPEVGYIVGIVSSTTVKVQIAPQTY